MPDKLDLREALDELWGLLELDQINLLDPETKQLCIDNHTFLWHKDRTKWLRP